MKQPPGDMIRVLPHPEETMDMERESSEREGTDRHGDPMNEEGDGRVSPVWRRMDITCIDHGEGLRVQLEAEARGESTRDALFEYIDEVRAHPDYEPNWVESMMEERR